MAQTRNASAEKLVADTEDGILLRQGFQTSIACIKSSEQPKVVSAKNAISTEISVSAKILFRQCTEISSFGRNLNSGFGRSLIKRLTLCRHLVTVDHEWLSCAWQIQV
jgi:hypothetical protein